jgi:hypothetical protein
VRRTTSRSPLRWITCCTATSALPPTAGLHQPLLMHDVGASEKNDIRGAQSHVPKSGGRQPAVVWNVERCVAGITLFAAQRIKSGGIRQPAVLAMRTARITHCWPTPWNRSGKRQPAVASGIALATATGFRGRITFAPHTRLPHHGWLTPAAPDARRRCTEKTTFAVHNRMFPRAAGVNPPCFAYKNAVPQESTHC